MSPFPNLLRIFSPDGPIPPVHIHQLLETLLPTQPGYATATPDRQAELRLATMHSLAAYQPEDAQEANLAALLVATQARVLDCFRRAALPDADDTSRRRDETGAASLLRCMQTLLRGLHQAQALRLKAEEKPSERAGWWFRDASVPEPAAQDAAPEQRDPMPGGAPAALDPAGARRDAGPSRRGPMDVSRAPDPGAPAAGGTAARATRQHPIHREPDDLWEHVQSGDAMARFASRRLDPNQSVEDAWAQAAAEAAAEDALASTPAAGTRATPHAP